MPTMNELGIRRFKTIEETPMEINKADRTIIHKITSTAVDRDQEVLLTNGLNFKYLRDTKSVLFNHDAYDVIAKNAWVKAYDDHARAKTQFADTERGREMYYLASEGYIKGWSIGMDWTTMKYCDDKEKVELVRKNPDYAPARRILKAADVVEYSLTPVPSNREALTDCLKANKLVATKSLIERFLDEPIDTEKPVAQTVKKIDPVIRRIPLTEKMITKEVESRVRLIRGFD